MCWACNHDDSDCEACLAWGADNLMLTVRRTIFDLKMLLVLMLKINLLEMGYRVFSSVREVIHIDLKQTTRARD